jgi:preprotein translocase subunit YajC
VDSSFLVILAVGVGAVYLLTRGQRKQQKNAQAFRENLAAGQQVMTGSGMFGEVVDVDGDTITLESTPGNRSRWLRAAIAKVIEPPVPDDDELDDDELDVPDDISSLDTDSPEAAGAAEPADDTPESPTDESPQK